MEGDKDKQQLTKKMSPHEFMQRFKARDPEIVEIWNEFVENHNKALEEFTAFCKDDHNLIYRLDGKAENVNWLCDAAAMSGNKTDIDGAYLNMKKNFERYREPLSTKPSIVSSGAELDFRSSIHEIPVEWDVLTAASNGCLKNLDIDGLEVKLSSQIPGSVVWQLRDQDYGNFGTLEVRKIGKGWSQIRFSGFEFVNDVDYSQREEKNARMRHIVSTYYELLIQENIWEQRPQAATPNLVDAQADQKWKPWLHIPDKNNHRELVKLWSEGWQAKEIAAKFSTKPQTVYNIISSLRKQYPQARIPKKHNANNEEHVDSR
jgi:hypothetical protein